MKSSIYNYSCLLLLFSLAACNSGNSSWTPVITGQVTYSESQLLLKVGGSTTITATYTGSNITTQPFTVNFLLSNFNIAIVNPSSCIISSQITCDLLITALSFGNSKLYATSKTFPVGNNSVIITVTQ